MQRTIGRKWDNTKKLINNYDDDDYSLLNHDINNKWRKKTLRNDKLIKMKRVLSAYTSILFMTKMTTSIISMIFLLIICTVQILPLVSARPQAPNGYFYPQSQQQQQQQQGSWNQPGGDPYYYPQNYQYNPNRNYYSQNNVGEGGYINDNSPQNLQQPNQPFNNGGQSQEPLSPSPLPSSSSSSSQPSSSQPSSPSSQQISNNQDQKQIDTTPSIKEPSDSASSFVTKPDPGVANEISPPNNEIHETIPLTTVSEENRPLGLAKSAFIGLVVGVSFGALIILAGALLFLKRHRRRRYVRPAEYKALKLSADSKKSFDARGSMERTPTTLLPARELLFPTQMSAAHHKTIYGAKDADTPVWDIKTDIERRGTIRIPKTRKTWFPALNNSRSSAAQKEKVERNASEDRKTERARKTTSWLAAFKLSSGIGESNDPVSPPVMVTTPRDISPPPNAARRSVSPSPRTSPRSMSPELGALDNPAGLNVRDSHRPKSPNLTPESAAGSPKLSIRLGSGLERRDSRKSWHPGMSSTDQLQKDIQDKDNNYNNTTIDQIPPVPPIPANFSSSASDPSSNQRGASNRLSWNPTVARRETLRAQNNSTSIPQGNSASRRSPRRSRNASAIANDRSAAAGASGSLSDSLSPPFGPTASAPDTNSGSLSDSGISSSNTSSSFSLPPLKRQSLFGEGAGMLDLDLERSSNVD